MPMPLEPPVTKATLPWSCGSRAMGLCPLSISPARGGRFATLPQGRGNPFLKSGQMPSPGQIAMPPSTLMTCPVMYLAFSLAMKATM